MTPEGAWVVVLAGGEGRRLGQVAADLYGYPRPKQFCAFGEDGSLVEQTLRRAMRLAKGQQRIVASVARAHRAEVEECLQAWPGVARVEQPANRDTAPGLILPLLYVLDRDPDAIVYVLPSDHHVSDDGRFVQALQTGVEALDDGEIAVLGAALDRPEPDLGWIVARPDDRRSTPAVAAFVEKPSSIELQEIFAGGAVANTFAMGGRASDFARLLDRHAPAWWRSARAAHADPLSITRVYRRLPPCNLSTEVLQPASASLRVARLVGVGWSDIGTPDRLRAALSPNAAPDRGRVVPEAC